MANSAVGERFFITGFMQIAVFAYRVIGRQPSTAIPYIRMTLIAGLRCACPQQIAAVTSNAISQRRGKAILMHFAIFIYRVVCR